MRTFRLPFLFRLYDEAFSSAHFNLRQKLSLFSVVFSLWFKYKFYSKKKLASQKIFGYKIYGHNYDNILYLFREIFLSNDYFFLPDTDTPKIIDCGANIGMATLYFKWLYPKSEIIAFEPNPHAFQLLEKNVSDNNLAGVTIHNVGLSNQTGELDFYINENPGTLLGSFQQVRGGDNLMKVKVKPLSFFLDNKTSYDLIKMDIEGAEWDVLMNMTGKGLFRNAKQYIVEYHHLINHQSRHFFEFMKIFEANHFLCNLKADFEKEREFQDVLLYCFRERNEKEAWNSLKKAASRKVTA